MTAERWTAAAVAFVLAGALTTGCSSGSAPEVLGERPPSSDGGAATPGPSSPPRGEPPDACELITQDDAEAAFGEPAVAGYESSDECWWSSEDDLKTINIVRRNDDLEEWRRSYDNSYWEPNDYGDEGYTGTALDSIVFRVGEDQYEINVVYSTAGSPEQVVQDLADTVIVRL